MRNRSTVIACKLLIFLVISSAVNLINAQDWAPGSNGQVMWAMNCEFAGPSIASQNSAGEACGDLCIANEDCNHFTWVYNVCYMKNLPGSPIANNLVANPPSVCGWVVNRDGGEGGGGGETFVFNGPNANAGIVIDADWGQGLSGAGVSISGSTVRMDYDNSGGARVYMTTPNGQQYQNLRLLNRELTFTVDTSRIGCGYNGALYFIDMSNAVNDASWGGGYCDAGGIFKPCHELDIWEANNAASVFTIHQPYDNGGCGYFINSAGYFYGPNNVLNSNQPFDIVTRFYTTDGQDSGVLSSIERVYRQNGAQVGPTQTLNDARCGGGGTSMSQMSDGMKNGMTLSLSLWGGPRCPGCNDWLDTGANGPCQPGQSDPGSGGYVIFSNIRMGAIGST